MSKFLLKVVDVFFWAFILAGCFYTGALVVEREHPIRCAFTCFICFLMVILLANISNRIKGE